MILRELAFKLQQELFKHAYSDPSMDQKKRLHDQYKIILAFLEKYAPLIKEL